MDEQRYFGLVDAYLEVSLIVQHLFLRDSRVEETELHNSNISNLDQPTNPHWVRSILCSQVFEPNT